MLKLLRTYKKTIFLSFANSCSIVFLSLSSACFCCHMLQLEKEKRTSSRKIFFILRLLKILTLKTKQSATFLQELPFLKDFLRLWLNFHCKYPVLNFLKVYQFPTQCFLIFFWLFFIFMTPLMNLCTFLVAFFNSATRLVLFDIFCYF